MSQSLLVVSIGPVQSFIAAARKTEDLWSGSYILSYLTEQAIAQLFREGEERGVKVEMVYPAVTPETLCPRPEDPYIDVASLPNRFVAMVEGAPSLAAALGEKVAETVRAALHRLCFSAIDTVFPQEIGRDVLVQLAEQQIEAFLEVFWATEPLDDEKLFHATQRKVERRVAAVKNNRSFPFHTQNGLICTVCGERDALHREPFGERDSISEMKRKLASLWNRRHEAFRRYAEGDEGEGRIKDAEYLCALCLGKRAAREFFRRERGAKQAFRRFESTKTVAGGYGYYALLMMDGDDMGQWFSGKKRLPGLAKDIRDIEHYREVSRRLSRFAKVVVSQVVKEHQGELVYAGGDDVLTFVPVDQVLPLAQKLRQAFSDPELGLGEEATASMGIMVAYYKDPLYSMLDHVRELEARAKAYEQKDSNKKKDAFALAYLAHSGELRRVVLPWNLKKKGEKNGKEESTVAQLQRLMKMFRREVSSTFLYTFAQAFLPLIDVKEGPKKKVSVFKEESLNEELLMFEFQRLLKRALKETGQQQDVSALADDLLRLHRASDSTFQFIQLLEIVRNLGGIIYGSAAAKTG